MFRVLAALLHGTLVVGVSQTAALNRGRHLYSAGRPSRWALAYISSCLCVRWDVFTLLEILLNSFFLWTLWLRLVKCWICEWLDETDCTAATEQWSSWWSVSQCFVTGMYSVCEGGCRHFRRSGVFWWNGLLRGHWPSINPSWLTGILLLSSLRLSLCVCLFLVALMVLCMQRC